MSSLLFTVDESMKQKLTSLTVMIRILMHVPQFYKNKNWKTQVSVNEKLQV